jgi:HAD superfamily hydrolase (TIGR01509 family)
MPKPSVVVFDLGKVLVDFDYGIAAGKIARRSRFSPVEMRQLLLETPLIGRLETGLISSDEFCGEVCAACGFSGRLDEFHATFADIFSEIKPMIALHAALRAGRMPTYIFSNTNDIAVGHIRERFSFFSQFDGYVLSYEHGAMKPAAKIYEVVEQQTGQKGKAILYLDDRPENVEAGLARGWRAMLHETPEKTISALRHLGLPVDLNP